MHTQEQEAVQVVDNLLHEAINRLVSDIHLEPMYDQLRVRFRIDGVLLDQTSINQSLMLQVISRLKVLAHMNIAKKRIPQDGKFQVSFSSSTMQKIDVRVSTFPSLYGEKMVVRILDHRMHTVSLDNLGFEDNVLQKFKQLISRPNGLLLVTGPTGSGKTTTLYAALVLLNDPEKNIVTLEDPIEYSLQGITQAQINPGVGFTFESGIRSVLRQDPDILMIGEIRDKQTARIAIEAALTGHLVLSTLHTNDAPSAVMRLMDMGIEPFLINAALIGVLAQRLARKICPMCRVMIIESDKQLLDRLQITHEVYQGNGCNSCDQLGYKGRVGIFELLPISTSLRSLIVKQPIFDTIYSQARVDGMRTLSHDGKNKAEDGIISLTEYLRVIK
ncbi:MAG: GspE/PulE family protein [Candidatus Babeliales bacterium]